DRIHPGVRAGDIHDFVSKEIENRGYKFYHSTGHGIGLDVHELPNIGPKSEDALEPGMAFTIEPGIYIPGKFGVRFEDTLSMKKNKIETLTG
ncbi:MAG: M24 family metallopeptidase, partial [Candidatus Altiarchaeota archaeon]|nr:M24 family metallopeptidase [Candidatus Altiarchaeota archaeon]